MATKRNKTSKARPNEISKRVGTARRFTGARDGGRRPLSASDFRLALETLHNLGFRWIADIPPSIFHEDADKYQSDEFLAIQERYPAFPTELGAVVLYTLLGARQSRQIVGDEETLQAKVEAARKFVVSAAYAADFFFRYATKVPYFTTIDWEIVIKTFERNVKDRQNVPYALLSIVLHQPLNPGLPLFVSAREQETETITVAANLRLLDKVIGDLTAARDALLMTQPGRPVEQPELAWEE